jgi:fused signal recognition particle receptor
VVFDALGEARRAGSDMVLVDTAGRLHTSKDLMEELRKVQRVAVAQSTFPVRSILVIDATTGQNGLVQARQFHDALGLDGIVLTKLDGTAKGGIAVAISRDLGLPILRLGVGEGIDDLQPFDATDFARALLGRG